MHWEEWGKTHHTEQIHKTELKEGREGRKNKSHKADNRMMKETLYIIYKSNAIKEKSKDKV